MPPGTWAKLVVRTRARSTDLSQRKKSILKVGTMVAGQYRIEGTVGRGGFGAVYKATQLSSGRCVALKVLLKNFSTSETDTKRFQREAAMVQKLRHPNVVEIYDFGYTERHRPYIAFELLTGESLGAAIKQRGALEFSRMCRVTRDILGALGSAHGMGIIHRDIKPQNIFLCDDGSAKVLDFGIAKAVREKDSQATQLTETGQMLGTPQYMAPEQVRGADIVPATDLYSLGLLMGEMLSGERVVPGGALIDVYMAHISEEPFELHPLVVNSVLGKVVRRAICKSLDERYSSAEQMLGEVNAALRGKRKPPATHKMPEMAADFDPLNATILMPESYRPHGQQEDGDSMAATAYIKPGEKPLSMSTVVMTPERHAQHMAALEAHSAAQAAAASAASAPGSEELHGTLEMEPVAAELRRTSTPWPDAPPPATDAPPPATVGRAPARTVPLTASDPSLMISMHEGTNSAPSDALQHVTGISPLPARSSRRGRQSNTLAWVLVLALLAAALAALTWLTVIAPA